MPSKQAGCPGCERPATRLLDDMSRNSGVVDYYRCDDCGHVWTTRKGSTDVLNHVTPKALTASLPPDRHSKPDRRRAS